MFQFVQYRYVFAVIVLVNLVLDRYHYINAISTPRRDSVDVFNLLLGLYKLNPLKGSKVYSKFAKNVLTQGDVAGILSSNENKKSFQALKEIENVIHPLIKKQSKHSLEKPEYDIEDVDTEKFNVDVILRDNFDTDYRHYDKYGGRNILEEYGIIKNNDNIMPDNVPNTRLVPVNQWLIPISKQHNPTEIRKFDNEYKPYEKQNEQIPNDLQEPPIINDNDLTEDVVVL